MCHRIFLPDIVKCHSITIRCDGILNPIARIRIQGVGMNKKKRPSPPLRLWCWAEWSRRRRLRRSPAGCSTPERVARSDRSRQRQHQLRPGCAASVSCDIDSGIVEGRSASHGQRRRRGQLRPGGHRRRQRTTTRSRSSCPVGFTGIKLDFDWAGRRRAWDPTTPGSICNALERSSDRQFVDEHRVQR